MAVLRKGRQIHTQNMGLFQWGPNWRDAMYVTCHKVAVCSAEVIMPYSLSEGLYFDRLQTLLSRSVSQDSTDKWNSKMLSLCPAAIPTNMAIFFIFPTWIAYSLLCSVCPLVGIHMDRNILTVCTFSDSSIHRPFPQTFFLLRFLTLFLPIPSKAAKPGASVDEAV